MPSSGKKEEEERRPRPLTPRTSAEPDVPALARDAALLRPYSGSESSHLADGPASGSSA